MRPVHREECVHALDRQQRFREEGDVDDRGLTWKNVDVRWIEQDDAGGGAGRGRRCEQETREERTDKPSLRLSDNYSLSRIH